MMGLWVTDVWEQTSCDGQGCESLMRGSKRHVMGLWATDAWSHYNYVMGLWLWISYNYNVYGVTLLAHLNVRTICMELGEVAHKWFKIGVQLGISRGKLKEFEKEVDPLSAVIDYWLNDNVEDAEVPVSWKSIVAALKSSYVGETGLANRISSKYCPMHQNEIERKGQNSCRYSVHDMT